MARAPVENAPSAVRVGPESRDFHGRCHACDVLKIALVFFELFNRVIHRRENDFYGEQIKKGWYVFEAYGFFLNWTQ
jgi:hypothetical protein